MKLEMLHHEFYLPQTSFNVVEEREPIFPYYYNWFHF
jgi:hypothetical protein